MGIACASSRPLQSRYDRIMSNTASAIIFDERPQTLGEEIANAISHGLGFLLAIASLPILVVMAVRHGTATHIVAVTISPFCIRKRITSAALRFSFGANSCAETPRSTTIVPSGTGALLAV